MGSLTLLDHHGNVLVNDSGVSNDEIFEAFEANYQNSPELAVLANWSRAAHRGGGLFNRDRYVTPNNIYKQMKVAQDAMENDEMVSGVLETTESLAFTRMAVESYDEDEEDIWEQIVEDLDLDARMREMWRELFSVSQFYAVTWWGNKTYKVSGRSSASGIKRKKVYPDLRVPIAISLLDPLRVMPVGNMMFQKETLCYIADRDEGEIIHSMLENNRSDDQVIVNIMMGEYSPTDNERRLLAELGFSNNRLFVLNPDNVWRVTATRPSYKRFAEIRLKSIFEILDLKHQLREMDRANLLGATNFIVLVKKGSDTLPAKPGEIGALQANVRQMAKVPILVGDHRLSVEIITPKVDHTLDSSKYSLLNSIIGGRLFGTFITNEATKKDDTLKLARMAARGMEARRYMLQKAIFKNILKPTYDLNTNINEIPKLMFYPNRIALDFDANLAMFMFDLRDRGEISRDTVLNLVDLEQDDEYRKRKREEVLYDKTFQTIVPYNGDGSADTSGGGGGATNKTAGRTGGGNKSGGGTAPGTGQGHSTGGSSEPVGPALNMTEEGSE